MRDNNKGLSLVEIIVVVAIMSALAGIMTIGLSSVISKPAEECGKKIVSALRDAKVTTMGKRTCYIEISQNTAGAPVYLTEYINGTAQIPTKVGEKNINVTLTTEGGTYDLSDIKTIRISYKRETGGFDKASFTASGSNKNEYLRTMVISKGTKTYTINLAYLTGKITIE